MADITNKDQSLADADKLVRREALLGQLRPIEDIVSAASAEIAKHRAACKAAEDSGRADPEQLRRARAAADGVEELVGRFGAMADDMSGQSKAVDEALTQLDDMLADLREQINGVVTRLEDLS